MKSLLGLLVLFSSFSCFGASIKCGISIFEDGSEMERLKMTEVVDNVGGRAHVLISTNKRFMFELGATYQKTSVPNYSSTRLAIHVSDLKNKTNSSLMAWFNETNNNFVFEGGDYSGSQYYVGKCSIKY